MSFIPPSPRDWTEDFADEDNGRYMHICPTCNLQFVAHKRRHGQCKVCHDLDDAEAKRRAEWLHAHNAPKDWVILTESEVAAMKADLVKLVWDKNEMERLLRRIRNEPDLLKRGGKGEQDQYAGLPAAYAHIDALFQRHTP